MNANPDPSIVSLIDPGALVSRRSIETAEGAGGAARAAFPSPCDLVRSVLRYCRGVGRSEGSAGGGDSGRHGVAGRDSVSRAHPELADAETWREDQHDAAGGIDLRLRAPE